ncbi:MAG: DNA-binding protein YbiB [Thiobacillaceae bacterium]
MSYAKLIRQIELGDGLDFIDARNLTAALLDGGVPELETAALLMALGQHDPGLDAWLGMHAALAERLPAFATPSTPYRTVILPSYHGVRNGAHLMPLLALLLKSFGIPVLIHGVLDGGGGTAAAYVLRELDVMPCSNVAQVNARLSDEGIAFAPVALLSSGLASLLALRARLGVESIATRLAVLADVMGADSVRVTPALRDEELPGMAALLTALGGRALLLKGCEGEAFADPHLRPAMNFYHDGRCEPICAAQQASSTAPDLPPVDTRATAAWMRGVLDGSHSVPLPLRNQLAACLYAAGYTDDLNQARAITSINGFGRIAA